MPKVAEEIHHPREVGSRVIPVCVVSRPPPPPLPLASSPCSCRRKRTSSLFEPPQSSAGRPLSLFSLFSPQASPLAPSIYFRRERFTTPEGLFGVTLPLDAVLHSIVYSFHMPHRVTLANYSTLTPPPPPLFFYPFLPCTSLAHNAPDLTLPFVCFSTWA